jgi:hypothetical protein
MTAVTLDNHALSCQHLGFRLTIRLTSLYTDLHTAQSTVTYGMTSPT